MAIQTHAFAFPAPPSSFRMAALLGLSELGLTAVHHAYGAYAYDTPWRLQVAAFAAVIGAVICGLFIGSHRHKNQATGIVLRWLGIVVTVIVPVIAIGMIEGGYNHFLKNLVYFAGDQALYHRMFPEPSYEAPGDWFFEITGIAQFVLGLFAGRAAILALVRRG